MARNVLSPQAQVTVIVLANLDAPRDSTLTML
jgi:hypothetical protein